MSHRTSSGKWATTTKRIRAADLNNLALTKVGSSPSRSTGKARTVAGPGRVVMKNRKIRGSPNYDTHALRRDRSP